MYSQVFCTFDWCEFNSVDPIATQDGNFPVDFLLTFSNLEFKNTWDNGAYPYTLGRVMKGHVFDWSLTYSRYITWPLVQFCCSKQINCRYLILAFSLLWMEITCIKMYEGVWHSIRMYDTMLVKVVSHCTWGIGAVRKILNEFQT